MPVRREVVRVEPLSNDRETWKAPAVVTRTEDQTEIVLRFFPHARPARAFVNGPAWPGRFDIEIDRVGARA